MEGRKKKRAPDSVCGREGKAGEWLEHGRLRRRGGATISEWMPARIKKVNRDRELGGAHKRDEESERALAASKR